MGPWGSADLRFL